MEQTILTALRSAIQERGLTIADVAKASKVNRTTLSLMLSGVKSPTLRTLCRVCGVLKIELKIVNKGEMPEKTNDMTNFAYQTNCGLGDKTPKGMTFKAKKFAGECQCGQGGCFGEWGEFTQNCESCGQPGGSEIHGLCPSCTEHSESMQHLDTQAWINESA